jgi:hypothetical protein
MYIDRARLLIRVSNQIPDSEDKRALLAWADELLAGTQVDNNLSGSKGLKPPIPVFRRYRGKLYKGLLLQGGKIQLNGRIYDSPSAAAGHISGHSENGWKVWRYINETTGEEQPIDRLRDK